MMPLRTVYYNLQIILLGKWKTFFACIRTQSLETISRRKRRKSNIFLSLRSKSWLNTKFGKMGRRHYSSLPITPYFFPASALLSSWLSLFIIAVVTVHRWYCFHRMLQLWLFNAFVFAEWFSCWCWLLLLSLLYSVGLGFRCGGVDCGRL